MSGSLIIPPGVPDGIAAAFTTRLGGTSRTPFASLNLGLSVGDDPSAVEENRRRVAQALGFGADALAIPGQVHGSDVIQVDAPGLVRGFDGMVTTRRGLLLGITAADCAAILLGDAAAGVVGACHAGWRGCVGGVIEHCVDRMCASGADPDAIRAWVGPCISAARFEVGEEVAARFDARFVIRRDGARRPHVDLPAAVEAGLRAAGVGTIHNSDRCTMSETDVFLSHRGENGTTGRMMGLIGLRPDHTDLSHS